MSRLTVRGSVLFVALFLALGGSLRADGAGKKAVKDLPSFGVMRTPAEDAVRARRTPGFRARAKPMRRRGKRLMCCGLRIVHCWIRSQARSRWASRPRRNY